MSRIQGDANKLLGLDPATGDQKKRWPSRGKHCSTPVASERFFMTAECEFTDFATGQATRARMLRVFPQLEDSRLEYVWGGYVDITMTRAPDFGRIGRNVYYLQGFSGHGIAMAGMAGRLAAEAIAGQDFAIVHTMVFLGSLLYILAYLATDIAYTFVDPRVRLA